MTRLHELMRPDPALGDRYVDELAGRIAEQQLAGALVRKSPDDPVPFAVWWQVADALRASVVGTPADAVAEVDAALAAVGAAAAERVAGGPDVVTDVDRGDRQLAVRRAQLLVARLLLGNGPTPPTLLQVRLARLRRTLLAAAEAEARP